MPKSLAEMRQSPDASLPTRTKKLCLAQAMVARAQSLAVEKDTLLVDDALGDDAAARADSDTKSRAVSPPPDPRIAEIDAEIEALWAQMRDHTGELTLQAIDSGEWRRWAIAHPARGNDADDKPLPGKDFDAAVAYGFCDADDLIGDLGRYAALWNGEALGEGDWEFIVNRAAPGDLKECAKLVVVMHEGDGILAPKASPKRSSETTQPEAA